MKFRFENSLSHFSGRTQKTWTSRQGSENEFFKYQEYRLDNVIHIMFWINSTSEIPSKQLLTSWPDLWINTIPEWEFTTCTNRLNFGMSPDGIWKAQIRFYSALTNLFWGDTVSSTAWSQMWLLRAAWQVNVHSLLSRQIFNLETINQLIFTGLWVRILQSWLEEVAGCKACGNTAGLGCCWFQKVEQVGWNGHHAGENR